MTNALSKIGHYILEEKCKVGAIWFEDEKMESDFMNSVRCTEKWRKRIHNLGIEQQIYQLDSSDADAENVLIIKGADLSEETYFSLLSLSRESGTSIYFIDESVQTSFVAEKVIWVDKSGSIADVITPDFFV